MTNDKKLKDLIGELWANIENGTIDDNFFQLREKVRGVMRNV